MKNILTFLLSVLFIMPLISQHSEELPYKSIPEAPGSYSAGNITGRMIDGLGYRYYWATEGLSVEDLNYKISEDSRPAGETIDHLYGLAKTINNAVMNVPNVRPLAEEQLSFAEKRVKTLNLFKNTSDRLKLSSEKELSEYKIVFQRGEKTSELPFWNLLNGQIADAIYHVGQIVTYRRASGNPLDSGVNVLIGKTRGN